jgi:hypothetical protein
MFKSVSWQEYLFVIGCLTTIYYVVGILIFYSKDILFRIRAAAATKEQPVISRVDSSPDKLMGNVSTSIRKKIPVKQSVATTDELVIASEPEDMIAANRADSPAAELLDDLDEIFMILATKKCEKEKYLKRIQSLLKQHPEFEAPSIQKDIIEFIVDYFRGNERLTFTPDEIENLLSNQKEEIINQPKTNSNYEK